MFIFRFKVPGNTGTGELEGYEPGMFDTILPEDFQNGIGINQDPDAFVAAYETPDVTQDNNNYQMLKASKKTLMDEDSNDDESNQVYGFDRYIYTKEPDDPPKVSESKRTDTDYQGQRVQVTTEETGSQRVQVNNGFQEEFVPGLNPESGRISSGVFLEWKLTFYGTGPSDSVSGDDEDDEDENDSSDVDLDL